MCLVYLLLNCSHESNSVTGGQPTLPTMHSDCQRFHVRSSSVTTSCVRLDPFPFNAVEQPQFGSGGNLSHNNVNKSIRTLKSSP